MRDWFWSLFGWQRFQYHTRTVWLKLPAGEEIPEWVRTWLFRAIVGEEPSRIIFRHRRR